MAIQTINLGTYANDGTGDDLRVAFQKVNANILELYSSVYGANVGATPPISGVEQGELWWSTVDGRMYVYYNGAWVDSSPEDGFVTYDLTADTTSGGANIQLNGTDLSQDSIKFASSTNITVTRTDANTITLSSTSYTGNVVGNLTGNVAGNVTGNVVGNTNGLHTGAVVGNVTGNLLGDTVGLHTGNVIGNVTGNTTGDTTGTHTGNVIGNLTGNASTVTNGVYTTSSVNALSDVDTVSVVPTNGQALVWNSGASQWRPGTVAGGAGGVSKITAGTNITISPTNGLGDVTINSTVSGNLDFGTFSAPAEFTLDMGTF
jgi:outer membrane lipoprotein SlyB